MKPMAQRLQHVALEDIGTHTADIAAEMQAGRTLQLIQGGKRIAQIVPCAQEPTPAEREASHQRLIALLEKGIDLGGVAPTRDEMHER